MRPSGILPIARAAASIALRPASGAMPAWAARPMKVATILCSAGAEATTLPTGPVWS